MVNTWGVALHRRAFRAPTKFCARVWVLQRLSGWAKFMTRSPRSTSPFYASASASIVAPSAAALPVFPSPADPKILVRWEMGIGADHNGLTKIVAQIRHLVNLVGSSAK